jgi:predicted Mrr-cat superfamily restriction endonuclease
MKPNAWALKVRTWDDDADGIVSRIDVCLKDHDVVMGWSAAEGMLDTSLSWDEFRAKLQGAYPDLQTAPVQAGRQAGSLWRFVREMAIGDYVIVPEPYQFYVARILGKPRYEPSFTETDTVHRRRLSG